MQVRVLVDGDKVIGVQQRILARIKGLDVCPFQADHVERELAARLQIGSVCKQPAFELRAKVPQRQGFGRALGQVVAHQRVELCAAYNGFEAGKIFFEGRIEAEPVLAVVYLKAFEAGEPVVRLDQGRSFRGVGDAIAPALRHRLILRQWMHDSGCKAALEFEKLAHRAAPSSASSEACAEVFAAAASRKRFALSASAWTSSNVGMLSS